MLAKQPSMVKQRLQKYGFFFVRCRFTKALVPDEKNWAGSEIAFRQGEETGEPADLTGFAGLVVLLKSAPRMPGWICLPFRGEAPMPSRIAV